MRALRFVIKIQIVKVGILSQIDPLVTTTCSYTIAFFLQTGLETLYKQIALNMEACVEQDQKLQVIYFLQY